MPTVERRVLHSWKEIADYVGRGVRTVQRWERDLGMPIRRPRAKTRSAVIAFADEIDLWLRSAPTIEALATREREREREREPEDVLLEPQPSDIELRERAAKALSRHQQTVSAMMEGLRQLRSSVIVFRTLNRNANHYSPYIMARKS